MRYGKSFSRPSSLVLMILLCVIGVCAQDNRCSLKLTDLPNAPELMGFQIGMTKDAVKDRIPQVAFGNTDDFGVSKTSINPDFDTRIDKSKFPGIRTVSLDFLDGRLSSLWLGYDGSFKWNSVTEFVKGISQSLHLPDAWTEWRTRGQRLRCMDFQMTVVTVAEGPSFRIIDQKAERTIAERRAAKEEENSGEESENAEEIVADRKNKVYYPQGCHPSTRIADSDRVVFESKEAAEQAGYKAAKNCAAS